MQHKPRIYIAVCSGRDWKAKFGASFGKLMYEAGRAGLDVFFNPLEGTSVLPRARQLVIQDAINGGFTHFFGLDDDMKVEETLLFQLLDRNLPIVGLNYARKDGSGGTMACGFDGAPVTSLGKTGVEEVPWMPFGGILIQLDAIKDMPKPWFETRWLEERQDFMGEDYYFCMKARTHGLKIYIDHDASNKCRHVGDFEYGERPGRVVADKVREAA